MDYPVVDDEVLRLDALRALEIVGTPRTAAFDAIANLAADTFACPISFISYLTKTANGSRPSADLESHRLLERLRFATTPCSVATCLSSRTPDATSDLRQIPL